MVISYNNPAQDNYDGWSNEALPLGNGKIGAKVFGIVKRERIHLNEKTLWSGGKDVDGYDGGITNPDGGRAFRKIQGLLKDGKEKEAEEMMKMLEGNMTGFGAYQSFGNLYFEFTDSEKYDNYSRSLELDSAVAKVKYTKKETLFSREYFISYPDNCFICKLKAQEGQMKLNFNTYIVSDQNGIPFAENTEISLAGNVIGNIDDEGNAKDRNNMKYGCFIKIITDGKTTSKENGVVEIRDATDALIIMSIKTNYVNRFPDFFSDINPLKTAKETVLKAAEKSFDELYNTHTADYKNLYGRVYFTLNEPKKTLQADNLLDVFKRCGENKALLYVMLYNYGRYLLISSSREDTLPANLQGIWNVENNPPWTCDYHFNVNIQMNYFGAYSANLAETAIAYIDFVNSIIKPGRIVANKTLGIGENKADGTPDTDKATGWVCHTMVTPLGFVGSGSWWHWGWAPTNGAWALEHTYDYYRYTLDIEKLKNDIYPAMQECSLMWSQLLIEEKDTGRLICSPSFSPEHGPLSQGITYDQSIIYNLFDKTLEAAKILREKGYEKEIDNALIDKIKPMLDKLQPISIGEWGQIKEWPEEDGFVNRGFDSKTVEKHHRHLSHLVGLYPFNIINPEDETLRRAVLTSLEDRGYKSTGWATVYRILCYARIYEGDICDKLIKSFIDNCVLDNLLSTHPPFQIDGSLGYIAAINEMILQSHLGFIKILPALPKALSNGEIRGIMARGNFEISFSWRDGNLESGTVFSKSGEVCRLCYDHRQLIIENEKGEKIKTEFRNNITCFQTEKGKIYRFC